MRRLLPVRWLIPAISVALAALPGCGGPGAFVRRGDANSVEIGYSGDMADALAAARRHCAQFERVPRFVGDVLDGAVFDCVPPGSGS